MAPQAFCCDQIRSPTFENEEYRLGLFIYWEKAGNKGPPTKDETPGLNVSFCVQVSQKPKSIRLFVPTGWGEFTEIDRKLLATPWVPQGYVPGEFVAGYGLRKEGQIVNSASDNVDKFQYQSSRSKWLWKPFLFNDN
ncbi:unnamed protein product [Penicillium discolor]